VSQVAVGISCGCIMFFVSVMCVTGPGINIEGLVQFEKIVTDIYKTLHQICSKGMVKGMWYFLFCYLISRCWDRFPGSEISGSLDSL